MLFYLLLFICFVLQALEAVQMVLNMTSNKRIDTELLERIMRELEGRALTMHSEGAVATNNYINANLAYPTDSPVESVNESASEESIVGRSQETEHLMQLFGKILQRVCKFFSHSHTSKQIRHNSCRHILFQHNTCRHMLCLILCSTSVLPPWVPDMHAFE